MRKAFLKEKVFALRGEGYSYTDIHEKTGVSKSTLSAWLSGFPYIPNEEVRSRLVKARNASGAIKRKMRLDSLERATEIAQKDIGQLSPRDIFMLGLGIYIGEGSKTNHVVGIVNSNPEVIRFGVFWFLNSCGLAMHNLGLRIHIYPDNDDRACREYWSGVTGIPLSQFQKTVVDSRAGKSPRNRGKLPFGTAHLVARSRGNKDLGFFLFRRINAWIDIVLSNQHMRA